jgi:hypothetical protein
VQKAERDALADGLARVYPPIAAQLIDLLGRIGRRSDLDLAGADMGDECDGAAEHR